MNDVRAITFDCFGTLVDWRAGVLAFVTPLLTRPMPSRHQQEDPRPTVTPAAWLERFSLIHDQLLRPWRPWREVLVRGFDLTMTQLGLEAFIDEGPGLVRSVGNWPIRSDGKQALKRLGRGRRLGLVVNADIDLLGDLIGLLQAPFSMLVTADQVEAYKPDPAIFVESLRRLGLAPAAVLHVAVDERLDLAPARSLGMRTARIGVEGQPGELWAPSLGALVEVLNASS